MMSMFVEAIVVAFCVGGAIGALVAMQLQLGANKQQVAKIDHHHRVSK